MRRWISIGTMAAAVTAAGMVAGLAAPNRTPQLADRMDDSKTVDVELVLAVDVSYSMDMDELAVQREGYAQAIRSGDFLKTLKTGPTGRIAVTYFEWAAAGDQKIILPWQVIDGPESADAVATEIMNAPLRRASRTSISGAINFAVPLFDQNPYHGLRRVIDISGDGRNNNGRDLEEVRAEALARGIVINGLPIVNDRPTRWGTPPERDLDLYYRDHVIGGPGAFFIVADGFHSFANAIRTKLVREIAMAPAPSLAGAGQPSARPRCCSLLALVPKPR